MADDPSQKAPPPPEDQFTLKIITPDGQRVYTVDATQLSRIAPALPINSSNDSDKNDVREVVDLSAPIAHRRYEDKPGDVGLFGTFIVNLSVYNPPK